MPEFYNKCKGLLKQFNVIPIPKINKNNQHIITLGKDKCKPLEKTGVLYKLNCKNCNAVYLGETKRALKKRINEHMKCKNRP